MRHSLHLTLLAALALAFTLAPCAPPPASAASDKEAEGLKTETKVYNVQDKSRDGGPGNDPARAEWFMDQAMGMFIHWSVDCPLGSVISHHLVGTTRDYQGRFFTEMPGFFNPKQFSPDDWATLARLAGMKYVVLTCKHHAGFCMWDTQTTSFSVMNTPFRRDITKELFNAFRKQGIKVGVYFSPDDFWFLYNQGHPVTRTRPEADPANNPDLMAYNQAQVRELLTQYGDIDFIFFDGNPAGLKQLAWKINPKILVTRGEMATPEQKLPGAPLPGPWEANFTMGTEWPFKPTNEEYKSGAELIKMLIEIRAKGGNLLINCGPDPDGVIPFEQTRRLRELALWMFVNGEAIYTIRPWIVTNEGSVWFTRARKGDSDKSLPGETVYAIETDTPWEWGTWREFTFKSMRATAATEAEVVGMTGENRCWSTEPCKTTWEQKPDGLHVRAMFAQRLYTDCKWPNPVVIRLKNVEPVTEAVPAILAAQKNEQRIYKGKADYMGRGKKPKAPKK